MFANENASIFQPTRNPSPRPRPFARNPDGGSGPDVTTDPAGVSRLPPDAPGSTPSGPDESGFNPAPAPARPSGGFFSMGAGGSIPQYLNPPAFQDPNDQGMNSLIAEQLKKVLGGETTFSPAVVTAMKSQLQDAIGGKLAAQEGEIGDQAAASGMTRAGQTQAQLAAARSSAASDYAGGVRNILIQKAQQDMQDKMDALDRSQKWLDDLRTYTIQSDTNKLERSKMQANLALAYAKLSQDRDALNAQLDQQWALAQPREGRDWIYITDPTTGQRRKIWLSALNQQQGFYQQA